MLAAELPQFYADILVDLYRAYRTGIGDDVTTTVRDVTGNDPIAFEQFARDHVQGLADPGRKQETAP